ncbi:MAG TPA: YfiR family protein, partial [Terriglobales bacterium]
MKGAATFGPPCQVLRTGEISSRIWIATLAALWMLAAPGMQAQSSKVSDYDVKAAYLFNFGRFVEWPEAGETDKRSVFTFCILGPDPFGPNLDHLLAGETINGRNLIVKRISNAQDSAGCQVLFMSKEEEGRVTKIIETLNQEAVLTVSDIPEFAKHGGMIQFVVEQNRVRFEVNLDATQR